MSELLTVMTFTKLTHWQERPSCWAQQWTRVLTRLISHFATTLFAINSEKRHFRCRWRNRFLLNWWRTTRGPWHSILILYLTSIEDLIHYAHPPHSVTVLIKHNDPPVEVLAWLVYTWQDYHTFFNWTLQLLSLCVLSNTINTNRLPN